MIVKLSTFSFLIATVLVASNRCICSGQTQIRRKKLSLLETIAFGINKATAIPSSRCFQGLDSMKPLLVEQQPH